MRVGQCCLVRVDVEQLHASSPRRLVDAVRAALRALGWRETTSGAPGLEWHSIASLAEELIRAAAARIAARRGDAVEAAVAAVAASEPLRNRFLFMAEAARKCTLARTLQRAATIYPAAYRWAPRAWCLPDQYAESLPAARTAGWYIYKPDGGSQGDGIFIEQARWVRVLHGVPAVQSVCGVV